MIGKQIEEITRKERPLYIFDIDGTLANIEHRVHMLSNEDDEERWNRFYDACDKDSPNLPVIQTMNALKLSGAEIWLFTGRTESTRGKTVAWLAEHTCFMSWDTQLDNILVMRPNGDYTVDHALKEGWLKGMLVEDRNRLMATFDDRQQVVDMWRRNDVLCFQVAPGKF